MALPKHHDPRRDDRRATAPYNFVPLPEEVLTDSDKLPGHDRYDTERRSGFIECRLTTETPLYIRGPLSLTEFTQAETERRTETAKAYDQQIADKPAFFYVNPETECPVIPGSTLRGMLRSLVEIVGYGKVDWVAPKPTVTFRAVAAPNDDPLRPPYENVMGRHGRHVRAGYLLQAGEEWYIQPAMQPKDLNWPEQGAYLKVKEETINRDELPDFVPFASPNYRPQYLEVSFDVKTQQGSRGPYVTLTKMGPREAGYPYQGALVSSGNMSETTDSGGSDRRNHALVLAPDQSRSPLKIAEQTLTDYLAAMTEFEQEAFDERRGCLLDGRPVFYVENNGTVLTFGHTPNFRIPAFLNDTSRAATPRDFVPKPLRKAEHPDLSERLFGFVDGEGEVESYAGRVSVGSARLMSEDAGPPSRSAITPQILASPKPTTFQHYLTQDASRGHHPDSKRDLAHYGTPTPDEAVIRGHKLYWHKHKDFSEDDVIDSDLEEYDTQHTLMKPVKPGTEFHFRIHFDNLQDHELGALLWALDLPGSSETDYRHKLGMGKPLGLGSVKIDIEDLHLSDRESRYCQLFADDQEDWHLPADDHGASQDQLIQSFESFVLGKLGKSPDKRLADLPRIRELLTMLEWPGPDPKDTEYMTNFDDRRVLPTPRGVRGSTRTNQNSTSEQGRPQSRRRQEESAPESGAQQESAEELLANLARASQSSKSKAPQVGDKVNAVVVAKEGFQVKVRILASQDEEVTFENPAYPKQVGEETKVKVKEVDSEGRVVAVQPG